MISIAHADDHNLVRDAICNIIADFGEFEIEITADNGEDLINRLENASSLPDICILDIHMPVKNGYDTIKEIKRRWPSIKCLILSMYSDETVVMKMIKNGANGFLVKNCPIPELRTALKTIHETGYYYSELTTKFVHKSLNTLQPIINKKELEFLSHCCDDTNYNEIAKKMGVSPRTVDGYRDSLFEKLNIKTRIGLAVYAIRNGIVSIFDEH